MLKISKIIRQLIHSKNSDQILVTGSAKTGTTIIYHSIREQLPKNAICQFEPETRNLPMPLKKNVPVLVKSFVPYIEKYNHFNKKILIIRDPRDTLISSTLYKPYGTVKKKIPGSEENTLKYIDELFILLRAKEQSPKSVSVHEIRKIYLKDGLLDRLQEIVKYFNKHPDVFLLKYEDFIDGHLDDLNNYLNLNIKAAQHVPEQRVVRSKAYGNWKDWLTPEDVEYYRPLLKEYMDTFGYPDDWSLNEHPVIDPKVSSEYVARLIEEAKSHWQ